MKQRLVMFKAFNGDHPIGVLPEAVVAVEHIAQDAAASIAGIAAGTFIHLMSGVALRVIGGVADVVDALGAKAKEAPHTAESGAAPPAPKT